MRRTGQLMYIPLRPCWGFQPLSDPRRLKPTAVCPLLLSPSAGRAVTRVPSGRQNSMRSVCTPVCTGAACPHLQHPFQHTAGLLVLATVQIMPPLQPPNLACMLALIFWFWFFIPKGCQGVTQLRHQTVSVYFPPCFTILKLFYNLLARQSSQHS